MKNYYNVNARDTIDICVGGRGTGRTIYVDIMRSTGVTDLNVIGYCLANYHDRYACGRFNNSGCKNIKSCERIQEILK